MSQDLCHTWDTPPPTEGLQRKFGPETENICQVDLVRNSPFILFQSRNRRQRGTALLLVVTAVVAASSPTPPEHE